MSGNHCFGCGPQNPLGLRLESFWDGEESVATFYPRPEHSAGPSHLMNGGISATLIDCHSICTATAFAYRAEKRAIGSAPEIWCVTGSLDLEYLAPVAIDQPVGLRARLVSVDGRKTRLECSLSSGGRECVRGRVLAVRVSSAWREPGSDAHREG